MGIKEDPGGNDPHVEVKERSIRFSFQDKTQKLVLKEDVTAEQLRQIVSDAFGLDTFSVIGLGLPHGGGLCPFPMAILRLGALEFASQGQSLEVMVAQDVEPVPDSLPTLDQIVSEPEMGKKFSQCMRSHGFFAFTVDAEANMIRNAVVEGAHQFFGRTKEEKEEFSKVVGSLEYQGGKAMPWGYGSVRNTGRESYDVSIESMKDNFAILYPWPEPKFSSATQVLFKEAFSITKKLLTVLLREGGVPSPVESVEQLIRDDVPLPAPWPLTSLLRILHYTAQETNSSDETHELPASFFPFDEPSWVPPAITCPEHSDTSLLTLAPVSTVPELQMLRPSDGKWVSVEVGAAPETFVVFSGALLSFLSKGLYPSAVHRVVRPREGVGRVAMPFFLRPSPVANMNVDFPHLVLKNKQNEPFHEMISRAGTGIAGPSRAHLKAASKQE